MTVYRLLVRILIFVILFPNLCYAKPNWVSAPPPSDSVYKFYVGRSSEAPTEEIAYKEATQDAYDQAIRENFGVSTRIDTETFESGKELTWTKRMQGHSNIVQIKRFEKTEEYKEEAEGKHFLWVLFRYPKSEIDVEQHRLDSQATQKEVVFSELGSPDDIERGTLEVITDPLGASVIIDGEQVSFADTPLRLFGKLSSGKHIVRLSHPLYEDVEEDAVIVPNKITRLTKILKRASGRLKITSTPSGAEVWVDHKRVDRTPTNFLTVIAGKELKLEIKHKEAEAYVQSLTLGKNEERIADIQLPLKPALISIRSKPQGAEIFLNDELKPFKTPATFSVVPGNYRVRVSKGTEGVAETTIELHGGENRKLASLVLENKEPEVKEWKSYKPSTPASDLNINTYIGFTFGYAFAPYKYFKDGSITVGMPFQLRFEAYVGLEVEPFLMYGPKSSGAQTQIEYKAFGVRAGLPLYILPENGIALVPEIITHSLASKSKDWLAYSDEDADVREDTVTALGGTFQWVRPSGFGKVRDEYGFRVSAHQYSNSSAYGTGSTSVRAAFIYMFGVQK